MILLLDLLVFAVIIGALLFLATQVVIPLMRGTVLFPIFGAGEAAEKVEVVEHQLEEIAEEERLKELTDELNRRKAQLKEGKEK